jgi:hypothetical protein
MSLTACGAEPPRSAPTRSKLLPKTFHVARHNHSRPPNRRCFPAIQLFHERRDAETPAQQVSLGRKSLFRCQDLCICARQQDTARPDPVGPDLPFVRCVPFGHGRPCHRSGRYLPFGPSRLVVPQFPGLPAVRSAPTVPVALQDPPPARPLVSGNTP